MRRRADEAGTRERGEDHWQQVAEAMAGRDEENSSASGSKNNGRSWTPRTGGGSASPSAYRSAPLAPEQPLTTHCTFTLGSPARQGNLLPLRSRPAQSASSAAREVGPAG